jgi:hypothetical protein
MPTEQEQEQVQTVNQAVNLLVQAAQLAQKRGAYNLDEAALLSQAINVLTASSEDTSELNALEPSDESAEE